MISIIKLTHCHSDKILILESWLKLLEKSGLFEFDTKSTCYDLKKNCAPKEIRYVHKKMRVFLYSLYSPENPISIRGHWTEIFHRIFKRKHTGVYTPYYMQFSGLRKNRSACVSRNDCDEGIGRPHISQPERCVFYYAH